MPASLLLRLIGAERHAQCMYSVVADLVSAIEGPTVLTSALKLNVGRTFYATRLQKGGKRVGVCGIVRISAALKII